ncbi:8-amino-7-oxononanoate synthase [Moraxella sp.]|uniref:aminotransferase class I/II-fold pyridoxal phosphate-dependent enzyme n=1 Tax=Moraxella sp. TaxID=479 RepID=UPI0026DAA23C|nr:8-amino-7-oxononanoate synthase [Moraxella sp.]MDO4894646.1 8-amino-7-oxononanoate synthase [Moraxella sp.]
MREHLLDDYAHQLTRLKQQNNHRHLYPLLHQGKYVKLGNDGALLLNLASNDYLGVTQDGLWQEEFVNHWQGGGFGSASSRLLTGNFAIYEQLEWRLSQLFGKSCLLFNSGYHANVGVIEAICDDKTVILADKLVHASMIDGIRLSQAKCVRYRHQDLSQLLRLVQKYQDDHTVRQIIIMTESIFSMDGDRTDLQALVNIKQAHDKVVLYVDEAHAIGVYGEHGLGCADQLGVMAKIDILVGTFGKALGSVGAYVACHQLIKDFLINRARTVIFSTALPPINMAWTDFVLAKLPDLASRRHRVQQFAGRLQAQIIDLGFDCPSSSQIVPMVLGSNNQALHAAQLLHNKGLFVLAVRPPTVPINQARLRFCLSASLDEQDMAYLTQSLQSLAKFDRHD